MVGGRVNRMTQVDKKTCWLFLFLFIHFFVVDRLRFTVADMKTDRFRRCLLLFVECDRQT